MNPLKKIISQSRFTIRIRACDQDLLNDRDKLMLRLITRISIRTAVNIKINYIIK
jgi:hypothetical protein